MTEKEIMQGLNCHVCGSMFDRCTNCPYYHTNLPDGFICRDELLTDAYELLKKKSLEMSYMEDTNSIGSIRGW